MNTTTTPRVPRSAPASPARRAGRPLAASAAAALVLVALAAPASAHVELEPVEAVAGSTTTLTFSFHHGLDGAATTGLTVRLPDGVTLVEEPTKDGWSVAVDEGEGTVRWEGGSVPDGTEESFTLDVLLPSTEGTLLFPAVQHGPAGDLAWISDDAGSETPAPRIEVVADPDQAVSDDTGTTQSTAAPDDDGASDAEAEEALDTTLTKDDDEGGSSLAPWVIGGGIAALAAVVGGGLALSRRR